MPNTWKLKLPVDERDLDRVEPGDVIYLSGPIFTGRSRMHVRVVEEGVSPPPELACTNAMYHSGPICRKNDSGEWEVVCANPTTSARFQYWLEKFIEKMGLKILMGEGGLPGQADLCRRHRCIYLVAAGSWAGALLADRIERVVGVYWLEMGVPEAAWLLEVKDFGPAVVEIDTRGNSIYDSRQASARDRILRARQALGVDSVEFGIF